MGVALVFKDFDAPLHKHKEDETYIFLYGTGKLHLDGNVREVSAPAIVDIPGGAVHAMTPKTSFVLLVFLFFEGPFESIKYQYLGPRMTDQLVTTPTSSPAVVSALVDKEAG